MTNHINYTQNAELTQWALYSYILNLSLFSGPGMVWIATFPQVKGVPSTVKCVMSLDGNGLVFKRRLCRLWGRTSCLWVELVLSLASCLLVVIVLSML